MWANSKTIAFCVKTGRCHSLDDAETVREFVMLEMVIKYVVRMMTNTVMLSLVYNFYLLNIRNLVYVQFLLQVAHLQSCSLVLLVELCPL